MASLLQKLPAAIARLEKSHGSQNPYVKQLKRQLQAMKETSGKSAFQVYSAGAIPNPPGEIISSDPEDPDSSAIAPDE